MSEILIKNCSLLTMNADDDLLEDAAVLLRDDRIAAVGPTDAITPTDAACELIDGRKKLVMPGLVNCHAHTPMTMTRSIADDVDAVNWLPLNWTVTSRFTEETAYLASRLAMVEMIAGGTTCFNDNYQHMEGVARAAEEMGIRADLGYGVNGKNGLDDGRRLIEQASAFVREWHGRDNGRIRARFSPHALYTTPTELVLEACNAARDLGVGVNMHVAESANEMGFVPEPLGPTSVQHLHKLGVLGPNFVIAHALTANEEDLTILADVGTGIAHCPQAVAKLGGYPFPNLEQWLALGVKVGLGTDGVGSNNDLDLIEEMRFASLVRKLMSHDGRSLPARQMLRLATRGGAAVLGLEDEIGSIEVGKKADLILIDLHQPHYTPLHNLRSHLVYSGHGQDVDTVIIDGNILYRNRQFTTIDIDEVIATTQDTFAKMMADAGWRVTMDEPEQSHLGALQQNVAQSALKIFSKLIDPE